MNVVLSVCRVEWLGVVGFGFGCGCYVGCEKAGTIALREGLRSEEATGGMNGCNGLLEVMCRCRFDIVISML